MCLIGSWWKAQRVKSQMGNPTPVGAASINLIVCIGYGTMLLIPVCCSVCLLGQHVLERTGVIVSAAGDVEGRFTVGLPAQGRSIMGPWAAEIITQHLDR